MYLFVNYIYECLSDRIVWAARREHIHTMDPRDGDQLVLTFRTDDSDVIDKSILMYICKYVV